MRPRLPGRGLLPFLVPVLLLVAGVTPAGSAQEPMVRRSWAQADLPQSVRELIGARPSSGGTAEHGDPAAGRYNERPEPATGRDEDAQVRRSLGGTVPLVVLGAVVLVLVAAVAAYLTAVRRREGGSRGPARPAGAAGSTGPWSPPDQKDPAAALKACYRAAHARVLAQTGAPPGLADGLLLRRLGRSPAAPLFKELSSLFQPVGYGHAEVTADTARKAAALTRELMARTGGGTAA